jgi:hypothetical protein
MRPGDPREEALRRGLDGIRPPDEADALERAVAISLAEQTEARRPAVRVGSARRLVGAVLAAAAVLVVALTPAGAAVRHWVGDAVDGASNEGVRPALTHVPSGGSLLVSSGPDQFAVSSDGSTKLLGSYDSVAWSAQAHYVAGAQGSRLAAIEPDGDLRWSITAPGPVSDQTWAPGCCRVGYRSEGGLFVVNGDGTDPHEVVNRVAPVAPAWMPTVYDIETQASPNVLAYVNDRDRLATINTDNGASSASAPLSAQPIVISWLDQQRILAIEPGGLEIVDTADGFVRELPVQLNGPITSAAVAPDGGSVAVLTQSDGAVNGVRSTLRLIQLDKHDDNPERVLFSESGRYDGPVFSPDGSRIELGWRKADQWRFVSTARGVDPVAIGGITREFDGSRNGEMPRIDGWCCS